MRSEGLCKGKVPLTPVGIEPATFRFVTQHLNHCATAVPTFYVKCPLIHFILVGFEFSGHILEKSSHAKFHENPSSLCRVVACEQTDGRRDGQSYFTKVTKNRDAKKRGILFLIKYNNFRITEHFKYFKDRPIAQSAHAVILNPLTPNDHYSGCTAPLTSKRCIFYIQQI